MTGRFQPRAQQSDMCRAADAVRAFDHDQLAAVFFLFNSGKGCAVKVLVVNVPWTAFS